MSSALPLNEKLWFTMGSHCAGKHYLLGNAHTFNGRMLAWCPLKEKSFYVSKTEMDDLSEEAQYWIKGFLSGNEPEPPVDDVGDMLAFDTPQYQFWLKATELFTETGYWYSGERQCESCGKDLLSSQIGDICDKCQQ